MRDLHKTAMIQHVKPLVPERYRLTLRRATGQVRRKPKYSSYNGSTDAVLQCCVAYNKYGGYCVPLPSYDPVSQEVLAGRVFEEETIELLTTHVRDGDVVHAGTFFGDFLPALSRACHAAGSTIWAFEPDLENYRCCSITLQINGLDNVRLHNVALGERSARMSMQVADGRGKTLGGGCRMLQGKSDESGSANGVATVSVVALDNVIPADRNISVLHLDVEGFEQQALIGAKQTIERCRPLLVLESVPDKRWLSEAFPALDYRITRSVDFNTVLTCD